MKQLPSIIFVLAVAAGDYYFVRLFRASAGKGDQTGLYIIGGLLACLTLLVVWSLAHLVAARLKGQMEIIFEDKVYEQGDELHGVVLLSLNRRVEARSLKICFSAESYRPESDHAGVHIFWKRESDLLAQSSLRQGEHRFDFSFPVPVIGSEAASEMLERLMTQALRGTLSWKLSAELDLPGANVMQQASVRVNDGDLFG